jgi:serine/threonine-protein kinase
VGYYGKAVPSLALLAAAKSLNLNASDIRLNVGDSVQIGKLKVRTDASARMLPQFYPPRDGKPAFAVDSFYDVLSGKIPASKYTDKIVLVGATATGVGTPFPAPGGQSLTPVELIAHITSSILNEQFIVQPAWSVFATLAPCCWWRATWSRCCRACPRPWAARSRLPCSSCCWVRNTACSRPAPRGCSWCSRRRCC